MKTDISNENLNKAYGNLSKYFYLNTANNQLRRTFQQKTLLKIPQDNFIDKIVNQIDARRIELEKKGEIIHDQYGDELVAKELFEDYLKKKNRVQYAAHLATLGLLGTNIYTTAFRHSVFLGKLGTVGSIGLFYGISRYISNNHLEKMIEWPWKIHLNRERQGLGATNIASNSHFEKNHRFHESTLIETNVKDILFARNWKPENRNPASRLPVNYDDFPVLPESVDQNEWYHNVINVDSERYRKVYQPHDPDYNAPSENDRFSHYHNIKEWNDLHSLTPDKNTNIYEPDNMNFGTIYKPNRSFIQEALGTDGYLSDERDFRVIPNKFLNNDIFADQNGAIPFYAQDLCSDINYAKDKFDKYRDSLISF